jgi:hypothetical protein
MGDLRVPAIVYLMSPAHMRTGVVSVSVAELGAGATLAAPPAIVPSAKITAAKAAPDVQDMIYM